jgi:hypothetical protein
MSFTPLPTPPSRQDPATFADRGDAFLGALPQFQVELNALGTQASVDAAAAAVSASNAADSEFIALSSANYKGEWSTLTGSLNKPAAVSHNEVFWALLNNLADVTASEPGVSADWITIPSGAKFYLYDNRNNVRSLVPQDGYQIIIESLGIFVFYESSTEIDDDETCFATSNGRFLLDAASFELNEALTLPADSIRDLEIARSNALDARIIDLELFSGKFLYGSGASAITSVAATTQASFTITVTGAAVGDRAFVSPGDALTARMSIYARVTADNTVTVYLNNPSAAASGTLSGLNLFTVAVLKQ